MNKLNYLNAILMLASACLAMFIPFELVLLSYAILGPAHYLTEISWLKGRHFFTLKKYDYLYIAAITIACLLFRLPSANLIFYTFGLSFILLAVKGNINRLLAFTLLIASGYFLLTNNLLRTIFGLYIPTLIHVYVFTGAFLLFGALKHKNVSGYVAFFTFLLCPLLLCVLFTRMHTVPTQWAISNYGHFKSLNTTSLRSQAIDIYTNPASIILTRLIAFAYTYHYINWFSKTRVINWHRIPVKWAIVITLVWIASVGIYFYNYHLGIKWLFLLSLAHVVLEFPLNYRSFAGIGKVIGHYVIGH
ncbi:hypothetical protein [Mucilaginibacter sp.]|uniref:hypothetical protein n=1 Tax=Mucilaginibacter sp. TaxID=1882438 RepID=UPI00260209FF|nr:hypothetical protein [Mucilaginibacter sp.]